MIRTKLATGLATTLTLSGCGDMSQPVVSGDRLEATLERTWQSPSPARQSIFSRDGRLLATANASGAIVVRRSGDWAIAAELDHPGGATALAFSADGARLYSAGYDGIVRVWELASARQVGLLTGSEGTIWSLDVSPDGDRLASAGEDKIIRIWRLDESAQPAVLRGHERNVWEVRFSPDGRRLASASFDASARLWDSATGASAARLDGHGEAVVGLDYSPDGDLIATGSDDSTVRLWRARDGTPLHILANGNHAYKVAFSPDSRWLASAGRARSGLGTFWHQLTGAGGHAAPVHLWRVGDGALVAALPHPDDVMYVAFNRDGGHLVTGGEDGAVRLWRLRAAGN